MAYVDLNPIRAGLADSLDDSEFTSIEQRVKEIVISQQLTVDSQKTSKVDQKKTKQQTLKLVDFIGGLDKDGIAYQLVDYLELVDWTGRAIRDDKLGYIDKSEPKIISKLGFTSDIWFKSMNQFSEHSYSHIGTEDQLKAVCDESGKKWLAGSKLSRELYVN